MNQSLRKLLTALFCIFSANVSYAINLKDFHNRNFETIGPMCGLHLEVSGDVVIATNIIPPKANAMESLCETYSRCTGQSMFLRCKQDGLCYFENEPNRVAYFLMTDGNIYNNVNRVKLLRTSATQYKWCQ
jgi:hypothetical protein